MTPLEYYLDQCQKGSLATDPEQLKILAHLDTLYQNLVIEVRRRQSWLGQFRANKLVTGIYLWGGVGVGKTFLMDTFYNCLPFAEKRRLHFHQFMQWVHQELTLHQGEKDPLQVIAKDLAKQTLLLAFDEFFVADITDAMLLGRLIRALFAQGVCLIATSNVAPDDLYKNGLQREQFLPAIELLKKDTQVLNIPTLSDYRLRHLLKAGVFYTPLDAAAQANMAKSFSILAQGQITYTTPIIIHDRPITVFSRAENVIWFDFMTICNPPRSQQDYLALASQFKTILISDIPKILPAAKNTIALFISLVDVLYDARVRLIISAAKGVSQLYEQGYLQAEYTRTQSRLLEMQSTDYFSGEV